VLGLALALALSAPSGVASEERCASVAQAQGRIDPPDYGARDCVLSPDGKRLTIVNSGRILVPSGRRDVEVGRMDYGKIDWRADSCGFVVFDSQGSGEAGAVSYVDVCDGPPTENDRLRQAAIALFRRTFQCHGAQVLVVTSMTSWRDERRINLIAEANSHSRGCGIADGDLNLVGDPLTGRISRVTVVKLP
jgi:hypothetical protein